MKSLFEKKLELARKEYLEENFDDAQEQREKEELKKLDSEVRKKEIVQKKRKLDALKKDEMKAKQNGTAL